MMAVSAAFRAARPLVQPPAQENDPERDQQKGAGFKQIGRQFALRMRKPQPKAEGRHNRDRGG
jgi:hypothetical protein